MTTEKDRESYRNGTILVGDRGQYRNWDTDPYVTGHVQDIVIGRRGTVSVIFKRDGYRETFNVGPEKFARNFVPEMA